tara:strand:+ start:356 stop:544 length:189 start_codon:yes stop_codon:yes gene_type:complete
MDHLTKQYIDSRQLIFLFSHGGEFWYEDPMGRLIGLKQIEQRVKDLSEKELDELETTIYDYD